MKPLRVEMKLWLEYLGRASLTFFAFCALASALSNMWWVAIEFTAFACISRFLLRLLGPVEADYGGIWQMTPAGRYEIKWSEVTHVEIATSPDFSRSTDIILHAPGKRLAIPGPSIWRREGRDEMIGFLESQFAAWRIPCERTARAAFQLSKNTKVTSEIHRPPLSP